MTSNINIIDLLLYMVFLKRIKIQALLQKITLVILNPINMDLAKAIFSTPNNIQASKQFDYEIFHATQLVLSFLYPLLLMCE